MRDGRLKRAKNEYVLLAGSSLFLCEPCTFVRECMCVRPVDIQRENGVLGISKAQNFLASQGRRLKAGAAKAPRGRRGRELLIFQPAHRFVIDLRSQTL